MSENPTPETPPAANKLALLKAKAGQAAELAQAGRTAVIEFLKGPFSFYTHLSRALASPDVPTRWMAWLFVLAQIGIVVVISVGVVKIAKNRQQAFQRLSQEQSESMAKLVEKQKQYAEAKNTNLRLGSFGIAMNDVPGSKRLPGVVNMAEIEIYVQCDTKETCDYLDENLIRSKDVIAQILTPMDREDLLSSDGKERLKNSISDRLNQWMPHGEIRKVFFSRVLID